MLIDCDGCAARGDGCADCVVTALLGSAPAPELPDETVTALGILAEGGLLPPLRLISGTAPADSPSERRFSDGESELRHTARPLAAGG